MSSGQLDFDSLRQTLDKRLLAPLFSRVSIEPPSDLPPIVFENRRRRARQRVADALAARGSDKVPKETRKEIENLVRKWSARAFEDSFPEADDLEIRLARERELVMAAQSGDEEEYLRIVERDYRRRVVERFGKIELRGIQTSHRVLADLDKVYVPLRLESSLPGPTSNELRKVLFEFFEFGVGKPAAEVIGAHDHLLIIGAPGSGKSTLVAYLAAECASGRLGKDLCWENDPLPLVLTVREWDEPPRKLADIAAQLGVDSRLIDGAIKRNRTMLMVDGLDETPAGSRAEWIKFLHDFVERNSGNRVVATSRPAGPPGEIESRVPFLKPFELSDLTQADTDQFIDNWCVAAELSVRTDTAEATRAAKAAADDLKSRIASSRSIQRLAVNPLLTTILCVVHRFLGRRIPEHRVTLYEKCTDALLYEWDQTKFSGESAVGQLDANQKRALLRGIARKLHEGHAAEISESDVAEHFARTMPSLGRPSSDAARIVSEIRDRSGVLVERRPEHFGFSHISFQEYLTALDYVHGKQLDDLVDKYDDEWWQEIIILAAGIPGSDSGKIAAALLDKKRPRAIILSALCLDVAVDMPLRVRKRIEKSLESLVPPKTNEAADQLAEIGIMVAPLLVSSLSTVQSLSEFEATIVALISLDYEPAIPAIAKISTDWDYRSDLLGSPPDKRLLSNIIYGREVALLALTLKAIKSDGALRAFRVALKHPWRKFVLKTIFDSLTGHARDPLTVILSHNRITEILTLLDRAIRASTPGKRSSTREQSTV